jgi:hypothetical protein
MGVTNYFSIEKASRDLGYKPVKQNDISDILSDLVKRGFRKKHVKTSLVFRMNWCANIVITLILTSFVLSYFPLWTLLTSEKASFSVFYDKWSRVSEK